MSADQIIWAGRIKKLGVGTSRRFSATTRDSLLKDLRTVLEPRCAVRAREVAAQMTTPAQSVAAATDLVERAAARGRTNR